MIEHADRCGLSALAIEDDGERVVVTLTDELQTALADADDKRLAAVCCAVFADR